MTKYGYARVSTPCQRNNHSLAAQEKKLLAYGCDEVVREVYSGAEVVRPALGELLAKVREGDEIVVTRVDRFARNLMAGITLFDTLEGMGVMVRVLDFDFNGELCGTPIAKLLRNILLMVAEHEHDQLKEQNRNNKAVAESRGNKVGRRRAEVDMERFEELRRLVEDGTTTATAAARELGVGRSTWYRLVREAA